MSHLEIMKHPCISSKPQSGQIMVCICSLHLLLTFLVESETKGKMVVWAAKKLKEFSGTVANIIYWCIAPKKRNIWNLSFWNEFIWFPKVAVKSLFKLWSIFFSKYFKRSQVWKRITCALIFCCCYLSLGEIFEILCKIVIFFQYVIDL